MDICALFLLLPILPVQLYIFPRSVPVCRCHALLRIHQVHILVYLPHSCFFEVGQLGVVSQQRI